MERRSFLGGLMASLGAGLCVPEAFGEIPDPQAGPVPEEVLNHCYQGACAPLDVPLPPLPQYVPDKLPDRSYKNSVPIDPLGIGTYEYGFEIQGPLRGWLEGPEGWDEPQLRPSTTAGLLLQGLQLSRSAFHDPVQNISHRWVGRMGCRQLLGPKQLVCEFARRDRPTDQPWLFYVQYGRYWLELQLLRSASCWQTTGTGDFLILEQPSYWCEHISLLSCVDDLVAASKRDPTADIVVRPEYQDLLDYVKLFNYESGTDSRNLPASLRCAARPQPADCAAAG